MSDVEELEALAAGNSVEIPISPDVLLDSVVVTARIVGDERKVVIKLIERLLPTCPPQTILREATLSPAQSIQAHEGSVYTLHFASAASRFCTAGADGVYRLWDATSFQCLESYPDQSATESPSQNVETVCDGAISSDGSVKILEGENVIRCMRGDELRVVSDNVEVEDVLVSENGDRCAALVLVDGTPEPVCWDTAALHNKPMKLSSWNAGKHGCIGFSLSPDGRLAASGQWSELSTVVLWDITTVESGTNLRGTNVETQCDEEITALAFSPDSKLLAAGGGYCDPSVYLCSLDDPQHWQRLGTHEYTLGKGDPDIRERICSVAFSPSGNSIASVNELGELCLWNVPSGNILRRERIAKLPHKGQLVFLQEDRIATTGIGGEVHIWDLA